MVKTITDLTPVVTPAGTDTVEVTQGGVSKKETLTQIVSLAGGGGFSTVFKTVDETINSDSVLTADGDMTFSVDANSYYALYFLIKVHTAATPDFKYRIVGPSGSLIWGDNSAMDHDSSNRIDLDGFDIVVTTFGTNNEFVLGHGLIEIGGSAGSVELQWAQNTSDVGDTTLKVGSHLAFKKLN